MNGYRDDLTIERKDVDGHYCPDNCTWIPKSEQPKNRSNNVYLTYQGERYILSDLARKAGISHSLMHYRLKNGWSVERAVETPAKKKSRRPVCETETAAKKNCAGAIVARKEIFVNDAI